MTTGAKVAIILGSATLLIGGGIGVYFLTRKKETTIGGGSGSSSTTTTSGNKIQDTANKVGDTAKTLTDTTEAIKGLGSAIGGLFKKDEKKEETASTGTLSDGTTIFTSKQSAIGEEKMSKQQMLKNYGIVM